MNVLDALRGEHAIIRLFLAGLFRRIHEQPEQDFRLALALIEEALVSHALFEDSLLFVRTLTAHEGITGTLRSMAEDHEAIQKQVRDLSCATNHLAHERCGALIETVREHFAIEERVLFSLASSMLSAEEIASLGDEWARRRGVDLADADARRAAANASGR